MSDELKPPDATPDEDKTAGTNRQLDRLAKIARKAKASVAGDDHEEWAKHERMFHGGKAHWHGYPGGLKLKFTNNVIRRQLELKISLLMDMNLGAEVVPREPGDEITAALLEAARTYVWHKQDVPETLEAIIKDALVVGTGIGKVYWENKTDDVKVARVDPRRMYLDPECSGFLDCRYCFEESFLTPSAIKSIWPKVDEKELVTDDDGWGERKLYDLEDDTIKESIRGKRMYHPTGTGTQATTTTTAIPASHVVQTDDEPKVRVQEWFVEKGPGKGYRHIVRAGRLILKDEDHPYQHGELPYFKIVDEIIPGRFWGDTTIRHATPVQKELDVVESIIAQNLHLTTANIVWNYAGSGVSNAQLQALMGKPGQIFLIKNPAFTPKRDYPPPLQANLFSYRDMLIDQVGKLMRMMEVVPPGARGWPAAGKIVEQLREAQLVEVRQTANYIVHGIKRMVRLMIGCIQEFYSDDRYVRIMGPLPAAFEGLPDPQNPEVPIAFSMDDATHFVRMNPDNLEGQWDTVVFESTWVTPSRKAVLDELKELKELDPDAIKTAYLIRLMNLSSTPGLKMQILRDLAALEEAPPEEPPPPEGAPPGMMGGGMPPMAPPMAPPMGGPM